jgi:chromosome segregation ATPase
MSKTTTQDNRVSELRHEIAEIEETLIRLENPTPAINGVKLQYSESLPLYDRLKAEIASESSRDEALKITEKLRSRLPQLKKELAEIEKAAKKDRYQAEYKALQPKIDALIDQINARSDELEDLLTLLNSLDKQALDAYSKANPRIVQTWDSRMDGFRKFLPRIERNNSASGFTLFNRIIQ